MMILFSLLNFLVCSPWGMWDLFFSLTFPMIMWDLYFFFCLIMADFIPHPFFNFSKSLDLSGNIVGHYTNGDLVSKDMYALLVI